MIESMINEFKPYLPLKITDVVWEDDVFNIYSSDWGFCALCAWRLSTNRRIVLGHLDENSKNIRKQIMDLEIIDIGFQSENHLDPIFYLSNGTKIEIFSTYTYEPWTFSIDHVMYSSTPAEPTAFNKTAYEPKSAISFFDRNNETFDEKTDKNVKNIFINEINNEELFFEEFANIFEFPIYFEKNWDSLRDCLFDLSWIKQNKINIIHFSIPFQNNLLNRNKYFKLLFDISIIWDHSSEHTLKIYFPIQYQATVEKIMIDSNKVLS